MRLEVLHDKTRRSKRLFKYVISCGLLLALLALGLTLFTRTSLEGEYSGPILNSLGDARLVFDSGGVVFLRDGESIPYGHYYWSPEEGWVLFQMGTNGTNKWRLEIAPLGFVLVSATNSEIRYPFRRTWRSFP